MAGGIPIARLLDVLDTDRLIEQFLATHHAGFCADCLAVALDIPPGQVSMTTRRLTTSEAIIVGHGRCSGCGRRRLIVKAA